MKKRLMLIVSLIALLGVAAAVVHAQSADTTTWVSAITYYTNSSTGGTLQVSFYAEGSSAPLLASPITLAPHKAGSLFVGSVGSVPNGFKGSAVLSSDVPVFATNVEIAASPNQNNYARALYNGFTADDAASTFYVPTVLRNQFNTNTIVGVQNVESFDAVATLKFYAVGSSTPTTQVDRTIKAQSSIVFKLADLGVPSPFNGSLVITTVRSGQPGTPAKVVASAGERDIVGRRNRAFEGVKSGATKLYMATMVCRFGSNQATSSYAVQNVGASAGNVTATFYGTNGAVLGTMPAQSLSVGGKLSINPCTFGVPTGASGSAVVNSTVPIIAVGKVGSNNGTGTAFNGEAAGSTNVVLPYIRWDNNFAANYRTNIAIMNVGAAAATSIQVRYYDGNGVLKGTQQVAGAGVSPLIKVNSSPAAAGVLTSGLFGYSPAGGAVEIVSNQPVVVVVRAARQITIGGTTYVFGEDYNGIPAQ